MARKSTVPSTNYFQKVSISATSFATAPDIILGPFPIAQLSFQNENTGSTSVVEYSFDGVTLHGEMDPSKLSASLTFPYRQVSTVWFRVKAGSSGTVVIRVEAYAL